VIRGRFLVQSGKRRPFVRAVFRFPALGNRRLDVPLLVDTGADRTILAPGDADRLSRRFGVSLPSLRKGISSVGVGGQASTRLIQSVLLMGQFTSPAFDLTILEPTAGPLPGMPSLLGRDILSYFALFMEEGTGRVLLLEPHEADALAL
jgi:hypothetical protein